jgi:hypothetical protein
MGENFDCTSKDEKTLPSNIGSSAPVTKRSRWRELLGQLTRTTVRGNVQPQIGQTCLIMTGVAGQDAGQMCIVTGTSKVMVEVALLHKDGTRVITKSKQPRSLVFLDPGLIITQDENGSVWVRGSTGI